MSDHEPLRPIGHISPTRGTAARETEPMTDTPATEPDRADEIIATYLARSWVDRTGPALQRARQLRAHLKSAGYTVAPTPERPRRPAPEHIMEPVRAAALEADEWAAARASRGAQEPTGASRDAGADGAPAEPAQGRSEPRAEDVSEEWVALAVRANADRNHADLCGCDQWPELCACGYTPTRWEHGDEAYTIAAVIPAVRAQVADEANALRAEAERLEHGNRGDSLEAIGVSAKAGHLEHAAKIARGDQ